MEAVMILWGGRGAKSTREGKTKHGTRTTKERQTEGRGRWRGGIRDGKRRFRFLGFSTERGKQWEEEAEEEEEEEEEAMEKRRNGGGEAGGSKAKLKQRRIDF
jgi:hypothetical protein